MLNKKKIWAIILSSKWVVKKLETTLNISNTFGTGTANTSAVEVQQRLEPWRWGAQWPAVEVDYGQLRAIIEADPLTTIQEVAKEFNINHSMVIQHLKSFHGHLANWKVEKNLMSGCLMSWPKIKLKNHCFEVSSLITCNNNKTFLDWIVMYNKSGFSMTTCDDQLCFFYREEAPKHFPKPNLHEKKVMVTVWWSGASLTHCSFLNHSETITSEKYAQQINEMHCKLQNLPLALVNRKGPILHNKAWLHTAQPSFTSWRTGLLYFVSSAIFTWPLAKWLPLVQASPQLFEGKMGPQPAGGRTCFPRVPQVLKHIFLCYGNKHISHWQKCVDCNGSYFDQKKMCLSLVIMI